MIRERVVREVSQMFADHLQEEQVGDSQDKQESHKITNQFIETLT
jgi:hypothetical protein